MASKRALTGGTGDVNPQWGMDWIGTSTTVNGQIEVRVPVPRNRLPRNNRAWTVEVLKVAAHIDVMDIPTATFRQQSYRTALSTSSVGVADRVHWDNPRLFAFLEKHVYLQSEVASPGTNVWAEKGLWVQDLTDGAGHGVLLGTDSFFVQYSVRGQASTGGLHVTRGKILYRFKEVDLTEYIGIVQSQQ